MPIDYKLYPANWKTEIRPAILARAKNCCEQCGVENYTYGYRDSEGKFYSSQTIFDALENEGYDHFDNELKNCFDKLGNPTNPIRIVLTIAHMDHDITNNDYSNLKALCQKCHLNHDKELHGKNVRETNRRKKKLQELF